MVPSHELKVSLPFVFDPDSIEMFIIRSDDKHELRRIKCCEDIGFVLLTKLVFQADPGEKDPVAFSGQLVINILSQYAIDGTFPVIIFFFVADKNGKLYFRSGEIFTNNP